MDSNAVPKEWYYYSYFSTDEEIGDSERLKIFPKGTQPVSDAMRIKFRPKPKICAQTRGGLTSPMQGAGPSSFLQHCAAYNPSNEDNYSIIY